jgi:predicted transposase/invertase (TIGR01784 family)
MANYIRFDWAIKKILRQKDNFVVLEGFLSVLLNEQIKINEILESESNKETEYDKFNRVDLLAKNSKDELIIIEVQNSKQLDYFQRMLYGVSKAITERMRSGYKYSEVKKVYSINIVYFELGHGNDYIYTGGTEFYSLHNPNEILLLSEIQKQQFQKDTVKDIFPEYYLLRVNDFDANAISPLEQWVSFLKTSQIPQNASAQGLPEAKQILNEMNMTENERIDYDNHLQNLMLQNSVIDTARIDGRSEGIKEGIEQEKLKIASKLIKLGISIEDILKSTDLSLEEIEKLKKECP